MNGKAQLVIGLVGHLVVTKRHISYCQIVKISSVCGFKTSYLNLCIGIELLSNSSGYRIQFHTIQAAALHFRWKHSKEVTDTHRRLQNISRFKTHLPYGIVDRLNDGRTGIVSIQSRSSCRSIFIFRKQIFQGKILLCPISFIRVKGIRETAPADEIRQNLLFFRSSVPIFVFQLKQSFNGFHVPCKFLLWSTFTKMVIRDMEIYRRNRFSLYHSTSFDRLIPFILSKHSLKDFTVFSTENRIGKGVVTKLNFSLFNLLYTKSSIIQIDRIPNLIIPF